MLDGYPGNTSGWRGKKFNFWSSCWLEYSLALGKEFLAGREVMHRFSEKLGLPQDPWDSWRCPKQFHDSVKRRRKKKIKSDKCLQEEANSHWSHQPGEEEPPADVFQVLYDRNSPRWGQFCAFLSCSQHLRPKHLPISPGVVLADNLNDKGMLINPWECLPTLSCGFILEFSMEIQKSVALFQPQIEFWDKSFFWAK